jgi:asparagine synthetase B (glutamine-hydrolysing)
MKCPHSKVAVLFSGGLDSAVIALLTDLCIPEDEPVDLINVAFSTTEREVQSNHSTSSGVTQLHLLTDPEFDVPDRILSKKTYEELLMLRPNRHWQYIEVQCTLW